MEKITNQKVNKIGREIAFAILKESSKHIVRRGAHVDYVCEEEKSYPIFYWTKTHQIRKINGSYHKVTGKDLDRMEEIKKLAEKQGDVFLIWTDALAGVVMGGKLSELMKDRESEGVLFPHKETTHKGGILYFSIHHIPTIGEIDKEVLEHLRNLISKNRTPKGQVSLL